MPRTSWCPVRVLPCGRSPTGRRGLIEVLLYHKVPVAPVGGSEANHVNHDAKEEGGEGELVPFASLVEDGHGGGKTCSRSQTEDVLSRADVEMKGGVGGGGSWLVCIYVPAV